MYGLMRWNNESMQRPRLIIQNQMLPPVILNVLIMFTTAFFLPRSLHTIFYLASIFVLAHYLPVSPFPACTPLTRFSNQRGFRSSKIFLPKKHTKNISGKTSSPILECCHAKSYSIINKEDSHSDTNIIQLPHNVHNLPRDFYIFIQSSPVIHTISTSLIRLTHYPRELSPRLYPIESTPTAQTSLLTLPIAGPANKMSLRGPPRDKNTPLVSPSTLAESLAFVKTRVGGIGGRQNPSPLLHIYTL